MGLEQAPPLATELPIITQVRNHHIDAYGHVNNARYLTYLEDARSDIFAQLGCSLEELSAREIQVFLTQVTLNFKKPAVMYDVLRIYGWFVEIRNRRATWWHEIHNEKSGEILLTGTATGLFFRHGKIITIPQDIKKRMLRLHQNNPEQGD